jgi:hypothetical protein
MTMKTTDWLIFENIPGDEEILHFWKAAQDIQCRRQISYGVALRTLRELCALGDVRSWKGWVEPVGVETSWMPPIPIKPKEWKDDQPDLEQHDKVAVVYVSKNDLEYWFDPTIKQPDWVPDDPDPDFTPEQILEIDYERRVSIKELMRMKQQPSEAKPALGKRPRIKALLTQYYPDGVPDPGLCNRQELQGRLLKADPTVGPLDFKTLKTAIDEYNVGKR